MKREEKTTAIAYAILAAVFYAVHVPVSKLLLERVSPALMASFLYLGAGSLAIALASGGVPPRFWICSSRYCWALWHMG